VDQFGSSLRRHEMSNSYLLVKRRFTVGLVTAFVTVCATSGAACAQADALLGTWSFVPEKSSFTPGPNPYRSMTLRFTATSEGLRNEAEGVGADGEPIDAMFEIIADGKPHAVTGFSAFDSSSYTPVGDRTTVYVRQKHGASVIVGSRMLSRDGETLFYREKSVDSQGRERGRATLVFEKQ
jgi:hypothetical protein